MWLPGGAPQRGNTTCEFYRADGLAVSLEIEQQLLLRYPVLEGILLSECIRLQQQPLANKLIGLLYRSYSHERRQKAGVAVLV